jgi:hypothetical protein
MNSIQRAFLRSKHWEIFALWLAVNVFFNMAANVANHQSPFSLYQESYAFPSRLLQSGILIVVWAWAYSTGSFLNSLMPATFRLRPSVFCLAVGGSWILSLWSPPFRLIPSLGMLAYLLVGLVCVAYVVRFPAKTLVIVETRQPALFWHYYGPFFAVLFFPFGIWFLQPRINDLYASHQSLVAPGDPVRPATQLPA